MPHGLSLVALDQSWSPFYFPIFAHLLYQCSLCAPCRLASSYKNPASGILRPILTSLSFVCFSRTTDDQRAHCTAARPLPCSKSLSKRFACSVTRSCLADIDALLRRQLPSPSIDYSCSDTLSHLRVADSDSPPLPLRISTSPPPRLVNRRHRTPASSFSHFTIELCAFSFIRGCGLFYLKNDKPRTHLLGHQDPAPYSGCICPCNIFLKSYLCCCCHRVSW